MAARQPEGPPPPPTVQRLRIKYAKRGRLRFVSHRDFARAFERALRRSGVPMAFSAGFSPHPKISYVGAAPTGAASEAEYLEIGLAAYTDPAKVHAALDIALPDGLDIVEVLPATGGGLAERMEVAQWRIELPDTSLADVAPILAAFLARDSVVVDRMTKKGLRRLDARAAVVNATAGGNATCAIIDLVVHQVTPVVRPDDVLTALGAVAELKEPLTSRSTRLAQGRLDDTTRALIDPLGPDRAAAARDGDSEGT